MSSAMFVARSPSRSICAFVLRIVTTRRKSVATGPSSAGVEALLLDRVLGEVDGRVAVDDRAGELRVLGLERLQGRLHGGGGALRVLAQVLPDGGDGLLVVDFHGHNQPNLPET